MALSDVSACTQQQPYFGTSYFSITSGVGWCPCRCALTCATQPMPAVCAYMCVRVHGRLVTVGPETPAITAFAMCTEKWVRL